MLLYTGEERLIGNFWRAVDVMVLGENLEVGDCEENEGYENFVF